MRDARLGVGDWAILAEAAFALAASSLAIALLPFRRIAQWLSASLPPETHWQNMAPTAVAILAINAWARRLPWKTVCFQKGLALHWMLRRRGIASRLHYGVDRHAEQGLRAHVWVSVDGEIVMGGDVAHEFVCLAVFPPPNQPATD